MRKNRRIAIILILSLILPLLPELGLNAEEILYSGKSGDLNWTINNEGCLTISGSGNYEFDGNIDGWWRVPAWCARAYNNDLVTSAVVDVQGITNCSGMFLHCNNLQQIKFVNFDTSKVTNMSEMFRFCSDLTELDLSGFDTSKVTDMSNMFEECGLTALDLSSFDTSSVINMSQMFDSCGNLTELDLSSFDTSEVTDMSFMFSWCQELTELDLSSFDTSEVTDMSFMFDWCAELKDLDVSSFDTSRVSDMSKMFRYCSSLEYVDVGTFNTSQVTDMGSMFEQCNQLTGLNLAGWDVSNVTYMSSMFWGSAIPDFNFLSEWDTSNVTAMSSMFRFSAITDFNFLSEWDTSNVTAIGGMFAGCDGLYKIDDLSFIDTSNVTDMSGLFQECENLTEINLRGLNTSKVTGMRRMFYGCSSLETVEFGDIDTSQVTNMDAMFAYCEKMEVLDMSNLDLGNLSDADAFSEEWQGADRTCKSMKEFYTPRSLKTPNGGMSLPVTEKKEVWFDEQGNVYSELRNLSESIRLRKGLKLDAPVADVKGGNYLEIKTVTLSVSEEGAEIYYTIDGSNPDRNHGILYTGPITISEAVELRAIAVKEDRPNSSIMSETYSFVVNKEEIAMKDLELGENRSGDVKDDIVQVFPGNYELSLALVPVKASCEEQVDGTYKVKVSVGIDREDLLDNETEWLRYKKCVKDLEDNSLSASGMKTLLQKFDSKTLSLTKVDRFKVIPEISALGYADVQIDRNGNIVNSDCKMQMSADWEGSIVWPFMTPFGPVYIKLAGGVGVEGEGVPALEILDSGAYSLQIKEGKIDIIPEISIEGGYGIDKVATLGAKGTAEVDFQIYPASRAEFQGAASIHAYVAFVFDEEYKFLTTEKELWDLTEDGTASSEQNLNAVGVSGSLEIADRSYAENTSSWNGGYRASSQFLSSGTEGTGVSEVQDTGMILQTSVMPNTLPMIRQIGEETVMIFQSDDSQRDSLNRSVLMYSVYNDGIWSEPMPVWDTGTNDMYVDIQIIGDQLCVVWQKINDKIVGGAEEAFTSMEKKSDICFAVYDQGNHCFTNAQYIVKDEYTDMLPRLALNGDNVTAAWVRNLDNDFMQESGKNQIVYSILENGIFGEKSVLWETDKQIGELIAFYRDGVLHAAAVTGHSGETQGNQVCIVNNEDEKVISPDSIFVSNVQYLEGTVCFWGEGSMYEYDLATEEIKQFTAGQSNILSSVKVYGSGSKTSLLWSESDENTGISHVYSSVKTETGFSNPVIIYTGTGMIKYMDAVLLEDGGWQMIMNTMQNTGEEHSIQFVSTTETPKVEVEMADEDPVLEDGRTDFSCLLTNTSEQVIRTLICHYEDASGVSKDIELPVEMQPGESRYQIIALDLPEVTDTTEGELTIYAEGQTDISANTVPIIVNQTDIQIDTSLAETEEEVCIAVTVTNNSNITTDAVVTLYGNPEQTEVLDRVELGEVTQKSGGVVYTFRVNKSDLTSVAEDAAYLSIVATSSKQDINEDNNIETKVVYNIQNTKALKGDINMDGATNLTDLMLCLNHVSQKTLLTGDAYAAADMDENGTVNIFDLMGLLNYVSQN